jgi:hypothetical protein
MNLISISLEVRRGKISAKDQLICSLAGAVRQQPVAGGHQLCVQAGLQTASLHTCFLMFLTTL